MGDVVEMNAQAPVEELPPPQFGEADPSELTAMLQEENIFSRLHMRKQSQHIAAQNERIKTLAARVADLEAQLAKKK